jgi:hypothetical protein
VQACSVDIVKITELTMQQLEDAAKSGDHVAARDLGRLLAMVAIEEWEPGQDLPEVRWLRAAVESAPDDRETLMLLAGQCAKQLSYLETSLELNPWHEAEPGVLERHRQDARDLYTRARTVSVGGEDEAGLDELAMMLGVDDNAPAEDAYSYYLLHGETGSGSMAYTMTVVGSDADEFKWACDQVITHPEIGFGEEDSTFTAYVEGTAVHSSGLPLRPDGSVDWDAIAVPELTGVLLPAGLPVPGRGLHYGFFVAEE